MTDWRIRIASIFLLSTVTFTVRIAPAQTAPPAVPNRSEGWNQATNILAVSSIAVELLFPRVFYSDPEVTVGWKGRWHVSVLAPVMTLASLALLNETALKEAFGALRPGCEGAPQGLPGCNSFGFVSTQSFLAASAVGQGLSHFLVDTIRWSGGRIHVGALIGEVGLPLVMAPITVVGRTEGNWETAGQAWGSAAIGVVAGLAVGFLYASMQRPECGYTGSLVCW